MFCQTKNTAVIYMKEVLDSLLQFYGTYSEVAKALGYSDRQYRNIRHRVKLEEELQPRIVLWIMSVFHSLPVKN